MNILLVNWQDRENPHAGGAEIHLFEIFGRLAAAGHRVRLVCSGWKGAVTQTSIDGIEVHRAGDRNTFALLGRWAVRRALRAEPPDVLVEDINKLPLFLARGTDLPFYAIVPHLFGATAFQEAPWPIAATVWLAERPLATAYRRAAFHAISESTRDDLVARGVPAERVRVIHPGVDSTHYSPDPAGRRAPAPRFLYVGRLKRYKGIGLALRALAHARRTRPDLQLDIAGTGDHRADLEALAAKLDLSSAVTFHGFVTEAEKMALLRQAWANLFPSPKEGWGITIVEAAACGTPSLASDSPGLRDSVRHGETGFLVPHGDVAALAERMLELAGSPQLVARLGRAARCFAESLTWERAADATADHLHDIISGRREAGPGGMIMQTTITVRHCEISAPLRERAVAVVERLGGIAQRPMEITVVFDTDGIQQTAELRLHVARGEVLVAKGEGADHRTALDRAEEKLRRQLEKASARPRRSRPSEAEPL